MPKSCENAFFLLRPKAFLDASQAQLRTTFADGAGGPTELPSQRFEGGTVTQAQAQVGVANASVNLPGGPIFPFMDDGIQALSTVPGQSEDLLNSSNLPVELSSKALFRNLWVEGRRLPDPTNDAREFPRSARDPECSPRLAQAAWCVPEAVRFVPVPSRVKIRSI